MYLQDAGQAGRCRDARRQVQEQEELRQVDPRHGFRGVEADVEDGVYELDDAEEDARLAEVGEEEEEEHAPPPPSPPI